MDVVAPLIKRHFDSVRQLSTREKNSQLVSRTMENANFVRIHPFSPKKFLPRDLALFEKLDKLALPLFLSKFNSIRFPKAKRTFSFSSLSLSQFQRDVNLRLYI